MHPWFRFFWRVKGEGRDEISLDTSPGKSTVTRAEDALTHHGGLAAWSGFLKHLGITQTPGNEIVAHVTGQDRGEATPEPVALLEARRDNTLIMFDELNNQWGFCGHCSRNAVVAELAAWLVLFGCAIEKPSPSKPSMGCMVTLPPYVNRPWNS